MKELQEILENYRAYLGQPLCLATVVNTRGSTYRKAGARMLIANQRQTIGSISGGCLETDVIAHAEKVWRTQQSVVLMYDTTPSEDILLGTGLGCNGVMEVLIEPLTAGNPCEHQMKLVEHIFAQHGCGIIATAMVREAGSGRRVVHRLLLGEGGTLHGEFPDDNLEELIVARMITALTRRRSDMCVLNAGNGAADVFLEYVAAPMPLFLFGAGYDAIPLVRMATDIGMAVTIVDHRPAFANGDRFPRAEIIVGRPDTVEAIDLPLDSRAAAVIMSHSYLIDQQWLKRLLPMELAYLGLMGPRKRTEKMLEDLRREGGSAALNLDQLHNPAGLDIGAESPEEIALAILGEIRAVATGNAGGLLREKKGAIHSPSLREAEEPEEAPETETRRWPA